MDQTEGLWEARPKTTTFWPKTPNFGNIEKGGFFCAMQNGIRPKAGKVGEGNNASTKLGFSIEMAADGFGVFNNDVIRGYLGQSDPDIIERDIQSISKIFEGLVITVSFCKLAAIIGNKKAGPWLTLPGTC
jgi:hypothetical protein